MPLKQGFGKANFQAGSEEKLDIVVEFVQMK